jgi:hypothetical protein
VQGEGKQFQIQERIQTAKSNRTFGSQSKKEGIFFIPSLTYSTLRLNFFRFFPHLELLGEGYFVLTIQAVYTILKVGVGLKAAYARLTGLIFQAGQITRLRLFYMQGIVS